MPDIEGHMTSSSADAETVAENLKEGGVFFKWTDGRGTAYEVFMYPQTCLKTKHTSWTAFSRGTAFGMVLVAVVRIGAFYFDLVSGNGNTFYEDYIREKLNFNSPVTATEFATFLNQIRQELAKEKA